MTTESGCAGGIAGWASRQAPSPAQSASPAAPPSQPGQPSVGRVARSTVAKVRPGVPIQASGCRNTSPATPGNAQTLAQGFQGKPPSANWRARSASVQAPANTSARRQPDGAYHAATQGSAMNTARMAASPGTAI